EVADRPCNRAAVDVVREHHGGPIVAHELAREAERLRDATRTLLLRVENIVAEVAPEIVDVIASRHEDQVAHPSVDESVDRPFNHRPIADREQMLVRDSRERVETRSGPAGQDDTLHPARCYGFSVPGGTQRERR